MFLPRYALYSAFHGIEGALKSRELIMREWTSRHEEAGVDNAGVDKAARRNRGGQRKVCCKVSLYKNCQLQSCSAFNCLSSVINMLAGGRTLPAEILPPSDLPSPVNGILWEMSERITQERIAIGSSNLVEGLTT